MVKNTSGGTGHKSLARKLFSTHSSFILPYPPLSQLAIVHKILGNSNCSITLNNNTTLIGHIRNKFRGKNKRHNLVSVLSIVLVGMREYEKPFKNCDILAIYDDIQIEQLKQNPSIEMDYLLQLRQENTFTNTKECNVEFTNEDEEEAKLSNDLTIKQKDDFKIDSLPDINIDDI